MGSYRSRVQFIRAWCSSLVISVEKAGARCFGQCQRWLIPRHRLLAAKTASERRESRMRSTGEAGVCVADVLDARLVVSPKIGFDTGLRIGQCPIDPVHIFAFQYPGPEPYCLTWPVSEHDQPHIRSPLQTAAPTSRLLRARAQANETILPIGVSGHGLPRFVHLDPPNPDQVLAVLRIC